MSVTFFLMHTIQKFVLQNERELISSYILQRDLNIALFLKNV